MDNERRSDLKMWDQKVVDNFVTGVFADIARHRDQDPERADEVARRLIGYLQNFLDASGEASEVDGDNGVGRGSQNGAAPSASNGQAAAASPSQDNRESEFGRHTQSKLRELVILEFLNKENRAVALRDVRDEVARNGFEATESAVISQLHRLVNLECLEKPNGAQGVYAVVEAGRARLASLRESHGPILDQWRAGR